MTVPTNTFITTSGVINREDLSNIVYRISPTETPFLSRCAKAKATNVLHEWTTDTLAAAANNANVEGDNSTAGAISPGVRLNNKAQISKKVVSISGTQQRVTSAGNLYTMSTQMAKSMLELKRDMEFALTQNTQIGSGTRQTRGLEGWIATNNNMGAGGAAPNPITDTAPTDGTARTFTETMLKDVIQKCWVAGGSPNVIMCGGLQKQAFITFNSGGTRFTDAPTKKWVSAIDVYVSDFGTLEVIPNRFQRARTAFILEMDKWAVAYLRSFEVADLAKTGDSDAKQIVVEYTLEARNEASSGAVRDLS